MLVAARTVQGVAAALASSVVLGMVVGLFEDPGDRARAMGAYAFVGAAGASIGLLLGGVLTEALSWRAIFLVNVPIGAVATLLVLRVLPRDPGACRGERPDLLGAVLVTLGLAGLVFAIVEPGGGAGSPPRWPSSCSPASVSARPGRRRRWCRRGCCARGRCRSATSPRCSPSPR